MIKFLAAVILVSLVTQSRADDSGTGSTNQPTQRPVLYEYLRGNPIRLILDFGCGVRDMLKDPELTKNVIKIRDSIPEIADKVMTCGKTIVFDAMNKRNSSIGRITSLFRLGNRNEITKSSDVYSYVVALPLTLPYFVFSQIKYDYKQSDQLDHEMDELFNALYKKCGNIIPDALQDGVAALEKLAEKYNYVGEVGGNF